MAFDTPGSSAISRVHYNPDLRVLSLTFRSGGTHHFADVPAEHYHGLKTAGSAGKYYHAHLAGKFEAAK